MALAARLPDVDLFLSAAAEEVLEIYKLPIDGLKPRFRIFRDKTASSVPVGMLYDDVYHTVVIAPASSNTVAKCALGISDSLPTNMFAQAGKLGLLGIVFACDTEPVVVTRSPHDWVTLRPRRIDDLGEDRDLVLVERDRMRSAVEEARQVLDFLGAALHRNPEVLRQRIDIAAAAAGHDDALDAARLGIAAAVSTLTPRAARG